MNEKHPVNIDMELEFVAASCNPSTHCFDQSSSSIIAFASDNNVMLMNENQDGFSVTSACRTGIADRITCIKWIRSFGNDDKDLQTLIASFTGGGINLFSTTPKTASLSPTLSMPKAHDGSVTFIDGVRLEAEVIVVSAGVDAVVRWWKVQSDGASLTPHTDQNNGRRLALCAAILPLSNMHALAALGYDNAVIELFKVDSELELKVLQRLQGHEDWIRDVSFLSHSGTLWLASGSQDGYIRVWCSPLPLSHSGSLEVQDIELDKLFMQLETVLVGHDGWVHSVVLRVDQVGNPQLLSASADKSLIIFSPPSDPSVSKTWVTTRRLGEVGGSGVGTGFFRAVFTESGRILANGWNGWYGWKWDEESGIWTDLVVPSGHSGPVTDLDWDPLGRYFVTCSADQTTRIFGQWSRKSVEKRLKNGETDGKLYSKDSQDPSKNSPTWHELARPQVHGHDMQCLAVVDSARFVSGAEEKVLRAFGAPASFSKTLVQISALTDRLRARYEFQPPGISEMPRGATVPALGLSNRVALSDKGDPGDVDAYISYRDVDLSQPPSEPHLKQNTLWPELQKLYGHGYEVYSLAAHPAGNVVVSSCKATKPEYAAIHVWRTLDWQLVTTLDTVHSLTVVQLAFSPHGLFLLSVSRDRTFALWQRGEDETSWSVKFFANKTASKHSRIIWCCSFTHDSKYFVTGSRDRMANLWRIEDDSVVFVCQAKLPDSVTAAAFAPDFIADKRYLLALGLDNGSLCLWSFDPETAVLTPLSEIEQSVNFHTSRTVTRLRFRPCVGDARRSMLLAAASVDCSVRLFSLNC